MLFYHYLLENGCCETAKLLVKEKGKHTNQIKWFEDIVNSPDGIALVEFEKFMIMKVNREKKPPWLRLQ